MLQSEVAAVARAKRGKINLLPVTTAPYLRAPPVARRPEQPRDLPLEMFAKISRLILFPSLLKGQPPPPLTSDIFGTWTQKGYVISKSPFRLRLLCLVLLLFRPTGIICTRDAAEAVVGGEAMPRRRRPSPLIYSIISAIRATRKLHFLGAAIFAVIPGSERKVSEN